MPAESEGDAELYGESPILAHMHGLAGVPSERVRDASADSGSPPA